MSVFTHIFDCEMEDNITFKNEKYWIKNGVLFVYNGNEECPVIPEGVSVIAQGAFAHSDIKNLICPGTLRIIEADAFASTKLEMVAFNYGLECINDRAFMNCSYLSEIYLPRSLKVIGSKAFSFTGISRVHLPDDILYVSVDAFVATPFSEKQRKVIKALYKEGF